MVILKWVLLVLYIIWILVYFFHYTFLIDKKEAERGGLIFAIIFFIFCPYVVIKAIILTKLGKKP
jgi:hypothetical protein